MKKREANFGLLFRHWLKSLLYPYNYPSSAFELKQTTGESFPFKDVAEHQCDALLAVQSKTGFLYKAPDDSRGVKPFDYFYLNFANAFVVINYSKYQTFYLIQIDTFLREKKNSARKSLTKSRASQIAYEIIDYKKPLKKV